MRLRLTSKQPETGDAISFFFQADSPVTWKAGQYGSYRLPHVDADERKDRRFFTVSAAPFEGSIRITTRISPKGSSFKRVLNQLKPGQEIELISISGDFTMDDPASEHVFVAGGIGITPFRSIIKQLDHYGQPINVTLLYSNRTDEFVFREELNEIAERHPEFKIRYLVEPQRVDQKVLSEFVGTKAKLWLSGPEPMVEALEKTSKELGFSDERIKTDFFPGYTWP